jgi:DNA-binding transcriptional regulator YhcF (GntR family)
MTDVSHGRARNAHISPAAEPERRRLANRLALAYLLDTIALARGERHLLEALLASAIVQANTDAVSRQADLQVTYAAADDIVPDAMRRPVSINALATSLGLPFETVRRRVRRLVSQQIAVVVDGGLVVPSAALSRPDYLMAAFASYERLRRLYRDLLALGLLEGLPSPSVGLRDGVVPLRTVARLATDYVLRFVELLMAHFGEIQDSLLFVSIVRWNTESLATNVRGGPGDRAEDFPSDRLRTPVTAAALARHIGLPAETVRRRVAGLEAQGLCRSEGRRGFIVPAEVLARPAVLAVMEDNARNLRRLFISLAQLGVLQIWDELS